MRPFSRAWSPGEQAQVEQRRRRLQVLLREPHDLVRAHHLVAQGKACIPQRVEERFHERGGFFGADDLGVDDQDDVRVAAKRNGAAAEAAYGGQRHPVRQPRMTLRLFEQELEARIEEARVRATERHPVFAPFEARDEPDAVPFEGVSKDVGFERGGGNA